MSLPQPPNSKDIAYCVEVPDIYDGVSIYVLKDGTVVNRWDDGHGYAIEGHERRWRLTEEAIRGHEAPGEGSRGSE